MITAAGAGASFCTVTPARLRPKTPKSPQRSQSQQQQLHQQPPQLPGHSSVPPVPATQTLGSSPPQFIHNLFVNRANSVPIPSNSTSVTSPTLQAFDDWDSVGDTYDNTFFRVSQSPTSSEFLEPPSPKSFYSVATSSSGGTARGVLGPSFDDYSLPTTSDRVYHSPTQSESRKLQHMWSSSPTDTMQTQFSASPETGGFYGTESDQSPRRSSRKTREVKVPPTSHGREICIAVIGRQDVGKSTFIQKACDLKAPPKQNAMSTKSVLVDKLMCEVKLVEVDCDRLDLESQPLAWPKLAEGQRPPFVDGALILYDVTNRDSIARVPELLDAFARVSLPNLLVASKCDAPLSRRQIDPSAIEHLGPFGGVETMQTSSKSTSQKKCMATILNIIIARRNEKSPRYLNGRRRANSTATNNSRGTSPRPSTARSGHSRASSEFSAALSKDFQQAVHGQSHGGPVQGRLSRPPLHGLASSTGGQLSQLSIPMGSTAPHLTLTTSSPMLEVTSVSPFRQSPSRQMSYNATSMLGPMVTAPRDSFLDIDDDSPADPDDVPLENDGLILEDLEPEEQKPARAVGMTWDELVDRLLQEKMSKADHNFVTIFLCFYRKIAPPKDLLKSILDRFEKANNDKILLARINTQLRYCMVLNQWVADHPGDFAHPKTRQKFTTFLTTLAGNRNTAFLAREMQQNLLNTVEDEDAMWGMSDGEKEEKEKDSTKQALLSPTLESSKQLGGESSGKAPERPALNIPHKELERRVSDAPSNMSILTPGGSLVREQYAQFMETPEEDIAAELTRIDWAEFSQIRPRDLVRHVSISQHQRDRYKNLQHVSRMISHFNHLAYWVANIILEKPKAKHRGRALEKFIEIAWILRHKNNYNAVGAVLAGINSTPVHRLSQTRELVNPGTQKKFMTLELLMGSHKSNFSYRLALENTSSERIPFIPLHRRDLVSTDEGNKTFLDRKMINWNKFQLMGDILMVIIESQRNPYRDLSRNVVVEKMILEAVISTNEDDLFERSLQLEASKSRDSGLASSQQKRGKSRWYFGSRE